MTLIDFPRVTPYPYPNALEQVYMRPDAALNLLAWLQAFRDRFGSYIRVNEGYRTLAGQTYWWNTYNQDPSLAAQPGYSNHGLGQAVDFEQGELTQTVLQWLRSTCATYGFQRYANEAWHFDYILPYTPVTATPELEEYEDMLVVRAIDGGIVPAGTKLMISLNASHSVSDTTLRALGIEPGTLYEANDPTLRIILRDHGVPEARAAAQDKADEAHSSILRRLKPISDKVGAIWS